MLSYLNNIQFSIDSYIYYLSFIYDYTSFCLINTVVYLWNDFLVDLKTLKWAHSLFLSWAKPCQLNYIYNGLIIDQLAQTWLYTNGNLFEYITWFGYNLSFQLEKDFYYIITSNNISKLNWVNLYIDIYWINISLSFFKLSFIFICLLNIFFFIKVIFKNIFFLSDTFIIKYLYLFESETELGTFDDILVFISLFFLIFSWFILSFFLFEYIFFFNFYFILVSFFFLIILVLFLPLNMFFNFGITFTTYLRGVSMTSSIFIEFLFDFISIIIILTRFVVQNIRYILIYWVFFEFFEWIVSDPSISLLNFYWLTKINFIFYSKLTYNNLEFWYFINLIILFIYYFYYFLHLLILLVIQFSAYFFVSFWLFFFFYTTFFLTKTEKYFYFKKYFEKTY